MGLLLEETIFREKIEKGFKREAEQKGGNLWFWKALIGW